ncbi:LOW QUALITY PROTEIN: 2-hydroxyacyl-CoA lyase 2-like [Pollicipes pollicipes]|uniref:LOW QUALITY PROTEIN: 2-hydroxyacyl-CoA lyase 2-like n=1 Tax=Pollicipes pollicipes TaxID=41117 RepID=UPI00188504B7|nr:LOW QUALITY PROTEIN: 2-hydroxyacyl-CoA lyase 2-like [Pollicipes pollicipes]
MYGLDDPALAFTFLGTALVGVCTGLLFNRFRLLYIWTHPPDAESPRTGGELVAEVLKGHGVEYIFTLVGGHISPILAGAERQGIRVVDTRHEASAVFAADAVARLSGTVGVAAVTAGPGVTNTVTAVKNAQLAESPVLLLGGAAASILKGRGALQDIDQLSLFASVCKHTCTVTSVRDVAPALRRALQLAQSGTPGPVFVELPIDVLYPYRLVHREMGIKPGGGPVQRAVNWYLQNYVDNIFAGAWEPRPVTPLPPSVPQPSEAQVRRAADLLRAARRPLLLVGSGATAPPMAAADTRRHIESLGVPCYLAGMARGLLGRRSRLQLRQERRAALQEADLIVLAGAVCDFRLSYGRALGRRARIVAVHRSREQLMRNADLFWKPTLAVQADVGSFLREVAAELTDYATDPAWLATLRARDDDKEERNAEMARQPATEHLNPLRVLARLEQQLPADALLVVDGGDFVASAAYVLRPRAPLAWLDPGAFGTLGVGGGFALGAKLARPDAEVWLVYGDGSCGYSVAEFDTFTRHRTPVIALVGNDAGWTQIAREQVPMFGTDVACRLAHCRYDQVAEGYGGRGLTLTGDHDDDDAIDTVLRRAQALARQGHSVLVNALIGSSKFREGSISV